jgi:hypothetical protein
VIALTMSSFCIKSVSPLQYHQASPNMVHTLTMVSTCEPGIYHLTSFSWSIDIYINTHLLIQYYHFMLYQVQVHTILYSLLNS